MTRSWLVVCAPFGGVSHGTRVCNIAECSKVRCLLAFHRLTKAHTTDHEGWSARALLLRLSSKATQFEWFASEMLSQDTPFVMMLRLASQLVR